MYDTFIPIPTVALAFASTVSFVRVIRSLTSRRASATTSAIVNKSVRSRAMGLLRKLCPMANIAFWIDARVNGARLNSVVGGGFAFFAGLDGGLATAGTFVLVVEAT